MLIIFVVTLIIIAMLLTPNITTVWGRGGYKRYIENFVPHYHLMVPPESVPPEPPSSLLTGLVEYWKMNEGTSERVGYHAGHSLYTTGTPVPLTTGVVNSAADFKNLNTIGLYNPMLPANSGDISLSTWYYISGNAILTYHFQNLASETLGTAYIDLFSIEWMGAGAAYASTPNAWHHFCATYNRVAGTGIVYIDGVEVYNGVVNVFDDEIVATKFLISHFGDPEDESRVDETAYWNRQLTEAEAVELETLPVYPF